MRLTADGRVAAQVLQINKGQPTNCDPRLQQWIFSSHMPLKKDGYDFHKIRLSPSLEKPETFYPRLAAGLAFIKLRIKINYSLEIINP